jgi:hypothetical protein
MTTAERIITVSIGAAAIIWSFVPGVTFYPGSLGLRSVKKEPIPKWLGRLGFIAVGSWFIYMGLRH